MANNGLPEGVAPLPKGETTGEWIAHQNLATQNYYLWENPELNSSNGGTQQAMNLLRTATYEARQKAFANGETLEGVDDGGGGLGAGRKETERLLQSRQLHGVNESAEAVKAISPEDYTVNPTLIEKNARASHPEEGVTQLGNADPLWLDTQLKAISQGRTDTTGLDEQKDILGQYKETIGLGELSPIDRARIAQSQQMRGIERRGAEGAVMQQAEEQGRAGGSAQLVARMRAGQSASQARSMDDLQTQALAQQNKQQLMGQAGTLGGQIQTAQDAIDRFNTEGERERERVRLEEENKARIISFGENTKNARIDADTKEKARLQGIGYEAGVEEKNAGITTGAEIINKSASGGARGQGAAGLGASGAVSNATQTAVNTLEHQDELDRAAEDARMAAIGQGIGGGVDAATALIGIYGPHGQRNSGEGY